MPEQLPLFPEDVGTEGKTPGRGAYSDYRRELGRNIPARAWRRRMGDFERGSRADPPVGFGGLDTPYPDSPSSGVDPDIVPMASDDARDSYWSENIHPESPAGRQRRAMANMDAPVPQGPLKWPREYSQESVSPSSLSTVQFEGVSPAHVHRMRGKNASVPSIQVEEHAGDPVVVDGNHRTAAALMDGALFVDAEVGRPKMGPHRVLTDEWGSQYYEKR